MAPGILESPPYINGDDLKSTHTIEIAETFEVPSIHESLSNPANQGNPVKNPQSELSNLIVHLEQKYQNPSLIVSPSHKIEVSDTPIPVPGPTQALIHVKSTGICGSDLHLWHRGAIGSLIVDKPSILGHEAAGIVLAVGTEVTNLRPGDRVAIEPGVPCHSCWLCTAGKYNLCEAVSFAGVCPHAGTARRFMTHEARYCYRIPDSMTFEQGALLEPLSVVLRAVEVCKGSISVGKPVLICGAGPIGLTALAVARASGAWPIAITDVDETRLEFAQQFVPDVETYRVRTGQSPQQCANEIRALYNVGPRDFEKGIPSENEYCAPSTVLECTGIESSIVTATLSCRRGGVVMVVGVGRSTMNNLPFMHLSLSEIDLRFINRYADTWPAAINALSNGRVLNLDKLITHTFPLEQAMLAMKTCADPKQASVKVQIVDVVDVDI